MADLIQVEDCEAFIASILTKLGTSSEISSRWAQLLVEASLLGVESHGIRMLERYVRHIEGGGINLLAKAKIISDNGPCVVIDARYGLGHITADDATRLAIGRAKQNGISCVTVKNSNHIGACGLYSRQVALSDCVAVCTTTCRAAMAPWGGKTALLGNNAIAVSAPIENKPPFLFDIATGMTAMGKITSAKDKNKDIPNSWALDSNGKVTTDPSAATLGSLLPVGGHKGYGLAMAIEILSSFLSGGLFSSEVESWIQQVKKPTGASFTVIVIDIGAFTNIADYKTRMSNWVTLLTSSETRDGFERIYYPGQKEAEDYEHRLKHGILLKPEVCEMFERLASRFNIKKPCYKR